MILPLGVEQALIVCCFMQSVKHLVTLRSTVGFIKGLNTHSQRNL